MTEASGIEDPAVQASEAIEVSNNVKVSLADLCAKGTSNYAKKNYDEAVDYYARASELQAELNGEMNPENSEILFLYGRSLFKVGQTKSDVLGGRVSGEKKSNGPRKSKPSANEDDDTKVDAVAEEGVALLAEKDALPEEKEDEGTNTKKPLFQFTGDENFDDDEDEEEDAEGEDDQDEDEDDLAASFEVLDLARVLFTRKLEQGNEVEGKGKEVEDPSMHKHIKERLGDTHDLLAEISLENERFPNAVSDFRQSLVYKQDLYPLESEILAEAHFKLSLALEFASITTVKEEGDGDVKAETQVDEEMREEAARELEKAIESTKVKLQNKEVELASTYSVDDNDITIKQIADVKEILADMEQRLVDLRAPPIDVNAAINGPAGAPDGVNPMSGILGLALGESPAAAQARIAEAKKTATDLTGLVRRKKAVKAESEEPSLTSNGKRKADDLDESAEQNEDDLSKKAKVEDVRDQGTA